MIAAVHGVTVLPDLGPNNLDTLKLGPPLAFVLRPTSKRVEHGAGFTRVPVHPIHVASPHPFGADRSRTHPGPRTADHTLDHTNCHNAGALFRSLASVNSF